MANTNRVVPRFATEAEEAQWWSDNREQHEEEFVRAVHEGTTTRTAQTLVQRINAAKLKGLSK